MILHFTKMHGCGNDYIYVNGFTQTVKNPSEVAISLSKRHFSIGADGVIIIKPSETADAYMEMYNADGSQGKMCGNGVRCVAKFVYDNNICKNNPLKIETPSGIKTIDLTVENDRVVFATVNMGKAEFSPECIPVLSADSKPVINQSHTFLGNMYNITAVSMGNPHCVIFVDDDFDLWGFDIEKYGSPIENDSLFPEKVNVEFAKKIDNTHFEMRVWERGSGETYACGTGACALVSAACVNNLAPEGEDIFVKLKGGTLKINYTKELVTLTGDANTVYTGQVEI